MAIAFVKAPPPAAAKRPLTEADAVDIWIQRWLRIRRRDILARYGCDPRRIYEIWEGSKFPASRARAMTVFRERYPGLADQTDFGCHQSIPTRSHDPAQLALFD